MLWAEADAKPMSQAALYRLMTWLSPAYPVGAFSYSGGLEWAVEAGDITDAESLCYWLQSLLTAGSGWGDGIFFCQTYHAVAGGDDHACAEIAELAAAFAPTRERYLEAVTLGRAFIEVTTAAWPCAALARLQHVCRASIVYPVAVGAACAGHAIPLGPAAHAFLTALCSNWISAGARLIPLGHTDCQRVLSALEAAVTTTAERALNSRLGDLGSATFRADLASALHETQYTRLFRS